MSLRRALGFLQVRQQTPETRQPTIFCPLGTSRAPSRASPQPPMPSAALLARLQALSARIATGSGSGGGVSALATTAASPLSAALSGAPSLYQPGVAAPVAAPRTISGSPSYTYVGGWPSAAVNAPWGTLATDAANSKPYSVVVPSTGVYTIIFNAALSASASGAHEAFVAVNGGAGADLESAATLLASAVLHPGTNPEAPIVATGSFAKGDTIQCGFFSPVGAVVDLDAVKTSVDITGAPTPAADGAWVFNGQTLTPSSLHYYGAPSVTPYTSNAPVAQPAQTPATSSAYYYVKWPSSVNKGITPSNDATGYGLVAAFEAPHIVRAGVNFSSNATGSFCVFISRNGGAGADLEATDDSLVATAVVNPLLTPSVDLTGVAYLAKNDRLYVGIAAASNSVLALDSGSMQLTSVGGVSQWAGNTAGSGLWSSGPLGVGTSNPSTTLEVAGSFKAASYSDLEQGYTNGSSSNAVSAAALSNAFGYLAVQGGAWGSNTAAWGSNAASWGSNAVGQQAVATFAGQSNVYGLASRFNSNVQVQGTLTVNNLTYLYSNITVYAVEEVRSNLVVQGTASLSNATGAATLYSAGAGLGVGAAPGAGYALDVAGQVRATGGYAALEQGVVSASTTVPASAGALSNAYGLVTARGDWNSNAARWGSNAVGQMAVTTYAGQSNVNALATVFSSNITVAGSVSATNLGLTRNRIINGDFRIDLLSGGALHAQTAQPLLVDKWQYESGSAGAVNLQQNSASPPTGYQYYGTVTVSTTATAVSTSYAQLYQNVQGTQLADLNWGTSSAVPVAVSFWVRSSVAGTYAFYMRNGSGSLRVYVSGFTIASANTWQYVTATVPGDTTGNWPKDTGSGMLFFITLVSGTNYQTTPGVWGSANMNGVSGMTNTWCATAGATFDVTGVQLERGTLATPFEFRPPVVESLLNNNVVLGSVAAGTVGNVCAGNLGMFRNRIINGDMRIAQRGTTSDQGTSPGYYVVDRWRYDATFGQGQFRIMQLALSSTDTPFGFGFRYAQRLSQNAAAWTSGTLTAFYNSQRIEGFNIADLSWGSGGTSAITVSFWVRTTAAPGTVLCLSVQNGAATYSYNHPFTMTASASQWQFVTATIPAPPTSTWPSDNSAGMLVHVCSIAATKLSSSPMTWQSGDLVGTTSSTAAASIFTGLNSSIDIAGVQLEKGTLATPFEFRPYPVELQLCQRYYEKSYPISVAPGSAFVLANRFLQGITCLNNAMTIQLAYKQTKRAAATVTFYTDGGTINSVTVYPNNSATANTVSTTANWSIEGNNESQITISASSVNSGYVGGVVIFHYTASAEL